MKLAFPFALALIIPACAPSPAPTECAWAQPILVSRDDVMTEETARQILTHNETGARVCGW